MNRFNTYFVLLTLALAAFVVACSSDDTAVEEPGIVVGKEKIDFEKEGGTFDLSVKSNVDLEVTSSESSWCTVAKTTSNSNTIVKYVITVTPNTTTEERTAILTVKGAGITETVAITQPAGNALILKGKTTFEVDAAGETVSVELQTNGAYTVVINNAWIVKTSSRALTDKTEHFVVTSNSGTERRGTITFTLGNITETVVVEQAAYALAGPDKTGMESDAKVLAAKIYAGWNLGNTLEAIGSETAWGNPKASKVLIDEVKSAGFNAVRIPCAWDDYIMDDDYTIKPEWLLRVKEVVDYCIDNDMYAVLNIHWDGGWLENNCTADVQEAVNKKQKALWTQIANNFLDYDERLLFAGCNEPNADDAAKMAVLRSYEQTFVDAVRATGGKNHYRNLIIQGPNTDIDKTHELFGNMPTDVVENRLMAEIHYYTPWQFCGMDKDESWGKMFYYWGTDYHVTGSDRNANLGEEAEMKTLFGKMKTQFVDKGIPVILGEYGVIRRDGLTGTELDAHLKSRAYFNECVTREARNYGLVPFYWDNGAGDFALMNRSENKIGDTQLMEAIMKGAKAGKYPF